MIRFILKRILYSLPLLLGITFLTFLCIYLAPGDFLDSLRLDPRVSPQTITLYQQKFLLDQPMISQYFAWLKNAVCGDFGYSFYYKAGVLAVLGSRIINTLILSLSSLFLIWILVIPLGVLCAKYQKTWFDKIVAGISYLGVSVPSFFLAILLLYWASLTNFLPLGGMRSIDFDQFSFWQKILDIARHLVIPVFVLSFGTAAMLARILRANMLETLGSAYILGAKSRGLSSARIVYVHALRNALNPMITIFGYQFSGILSGAALTEIILGWPGLGQMTLQAVQAQDLYLVMGTIVISGGLLLIGNLLADILLAVFDPRIRV